MDITTILGLLISFGVVGYAMATGEGGLGLFYNLPAMLLVDPVTLTPTPRPCQPQPRAAAISRSASSMVSL